VNCSRCGTGEREVNFSRAAGEWLCLDCAEPHLPSAPPASSRPGPPKRPDPFARPLDRVLTGLRAHCGADAYRAGQELDQWTARCPLHPDAGFTLDVRELPDGKVALRCRVGCPPKAIHNVLVPDPQREEAADATARALLWAQRYRSGTAA
jgi:hypothetical protein